MNWEKINNCEHEWTDYYKTGPCDTPYCSYRELHCRKCGVYHTECGCGFENAMSGEPRNKTLRRLANRKQGVMKWNYQKK